MTKQITLEEALKLVTFKHMDDCGWQVNSVDGKVFGNVKGDVIGSVNGVVYASVHGGVGGDVWGDVWGDLNGYVGGNVRGNVYGDVEGDVKGTINGREWTFVETPEEKLQQLITELGSQELLKLINQMENN